MILQVLSSSILRVIGGMSVLMVARKYTVAKLSQGPPNKKAMGFSKPKTSAPVDWAARDLQRQSTLAAIKQSEQKLSLPQADAGYVSPPSQQTAADQAAAERMARQNMAKKKGIAHSLNPNPQSM